MLPAVCMEILLHVVQQWDDRSVPDLIVAMIVPDTDRVSCLPLGHLARDKLLKQRPEQYMYCS